MAGDVCSEDTRIVFVCVCVTGVFAGKADGCWGFLCVSMVLTEVDNCSNDFGASGGSTESGISCRRYRAAWLDVSQLLCLSIT